MGDLRYGPFYERIRDSEDPVSDLRSLTDEEVVSALAAASLHKDPYLANVLATESQNRANQKETIIETAKEGLLALDADGRLTFMNHAAEEMLGWSREDLLGKRVWAELRTRDCCLPARPEGDGFLNGEEELRRRDGSTLPVEYSSAPILREGDWRGNVIVFRDVTERKRSEEALRESEERFRQLADNLEVVFWMNQSDFSRLLYVSPAFERIWGRPRSDLYRDVAIWRDSIHPDDRSHVFRANERMVRERVPYNVEYRIRRPDGEERWIRDRGMPVVDSHGNVYRIAGIAEDVTDRKRAEETRAFLSSVVNSSTDAIIGKDLEGVIRSWNAGAERLYGYTAAEAIGRPSSMLAPPEAKEDVPRILQAIARGESVQRNDALRLTKDGRCLHVSLSISPVRTEDGRIVGASTIARDVTADRASEEKIRFQARLLDAVGQAVIATDLDGRILYWNRAAEELYGWKQEEALSRSVMETVVTAARDGGNAFSEVILAQLRSGRSWTGILRLLRRDGTEFPALVTDTPVRDPQGNLVGIIGVSRDVTALKEAERTLRASEARFRAAFAHATIGMAIISREGALLQVNKALERITGYAEGELRRMTLRTLTHPDDLPANLALLRKLQRGEVPAFTIERRYVHKDGHVIWVQNSVSRIEHPTGGPEYGVVLVEDVTKRRIAEDALAKREAQYRALFDDVPVGIYRTAPDGRILEANPALLRLMDYPDLETYRNTRPQDLFVNPDDRKRLKRILEREGAVRGFEVQVRRYDGELSWVRTSGTAVRDPEGRILWYEGIVEDVTERKRAAEAFEEREAHYRSIVEAADNVQVGIAMVSGLPHERRITYLNEAGARILGVEREAAIGKPSLDFIPPEERGRVHRLRRAAEEGLSPPRYEEVTVMRPDGTRVAVELGVGQVAPEGVPRTIILFRDVTERQRLESERGRLTAELEARVRDRTRVLAAANTELEAFAYSVGHDLRAPLRGIEALSQALQEDHESRLDDEGKLFLARIRQESARLSSLVGDLLALSRVARTEIQREEVDLSALAREILRELQGGDPERQVDIDIADGLRCEGDPRLLRLVLENLLGNAWKFTGKRRLARIAFGALDREGERVCYVRDNGVGFDPGQAERLFHAFTRLHAAEGFEGTGIGLATVKRIVERHGGRVWAEGAEGEGATLFFTLPGAPDSVKHAPNE